VLRFLDAIRPIAERMGATLAQLVIAWTVRQAGITSALVGVRNTKQAEENARAADLVLSAEDLAAIADRLAEVRLEL
jgi:aryl-alcohol dehydrogenase-like predicted oxidoreductase